MKYDYKEVRKVGDKANRILFGSGEKLTPEEQKIAKEIGFITSKKELDDYFLK